VGASMIRTRGLTKHFGDVVALDGLDLQVQRGEVVGFLGPNGAGKSTTIRLLLGLIRPTAGQAWLGGVPVGDVAHAHRSVSYVPGDVSLWPQLTGAETVELLGRLHGWFDADYRDKLFERFDFDPTKKARSYSRGNRQKIALIAALMTRAELLLLDEPTAGLDPLMEMVFRECVGEAKARGQTVFLSSHILSEVEALCHRVGILRAGRLVEVAPLESLRHLSVRRVEIAFDGPAPDLSRVPGVAAVTVHDGSVQLQLQGSIDPLIKELSGHRVASLNTHEPSLEEVFVTYYGEDKR
jgi:ABC-2 type transport system ATP-binding protein